MRLLDKSVSRLVEISVLEVHVMTRKGSWHSRAERAPARVDAVLRTKPALSWTMSKKWNSFVQQLILASIIKFLSASWEGELPPCARWPLQAATARPDENGEMDLDTKFGLYHTTQFHTCLVPLPNHHGDSGKYLGLMLNILIEAAGNSSQQ